MDESARVAQLMDEVEKRDKTIARLRKENEALQVRKTPIDLFQCTNLPMAFIDHLMFQVFCLIYVPFVSNNSAVQVCHKKA